MSWKYEVITGRLWNNAELVGTGYSGHGDAVNDTDYEREAGIGPIPRGKYTIGRFFDDAGGKGPIVAHLIPQHGTDTFGRSGFMLHGDNQGANESASHGCIIMARTIREAVMASNDRDLEVV